MNNVVHFEIHASDPNKVAKFYQEVFGWEITVAGPEFGGYRMIMTPGNKTDGGPATLGINGGMTLRKGEMPKSGEPVNAYVCIISVENLDATLTTALAAGGTMALDKMDVPHVGLLAYMKDPDNNLFGILQPSPQMSVQK